MLYRFQLLRDGHWNNNEEVFSANADSEQDARARIEQKNEWDGGSLLASNETIGESIPEKEAGCFGDYVEQCSCCHAGASQPVFQAQ